MKPVGSQSPVTWRGYSIARGELKLFLSTEGFMSFGLQKVLATCRHWHNQGVFVEGRLLWSDNRFTLEVGWVIIDIVLT